MPIQFGPTKIGAMQYGGVTIGEAMYNGQIVYKSAAYPATGGWTGTWGGSYTVMQTHTMLESGTFVITHSMDLTSGGGAVYIRAPGGRVVAGPTAAMPNVAQGYPTTSSISATWALAAGDLIEFEMTGAGVGGSGSATWSIVPA